MDLPSASIVVQGLLRPASAEECIFIRKHSSVCGSKDYEVPNIGKATEEKINGLSATCHDMHEFPVLC